MTGESFLPGTGVTGRAATRVALEVPRVLAIEPWLRDAVFGLVVCLLVAAVVTLGLVIVRGTGRRRDRRRGG